MIQESQLGAVLDAFQYPFLLWCFVRNLFVAILVVFVPLSCVGCSDSSKTLSEVDSCDLIKRHEYYLYSNPTAYASRQKGGMEKLRVLKEMFSECKKNAELGNPYAQNSLGQMYAIGHGGVARNEAEGVVWFRKAAAQGFAPAQKNLASMYINGEGVTKDYAQGLAWLHKAADQGNADAQRSFGFMYAHGSGGLIQDKAQSFAWYRRAAAQGDTRAQRILSRMYDNGEGVAKDKEQGAYWMRRAAEQGDSYAQLLLGERYRTGEGVDQDYTRAMKWFRKAADQYEPDAHYRIGEMYEKGEGVSVDKERAARWYCGTIGKGGVSLEDEARAALKRLGKSGSCW